MSVGQRSSSTGYIGGHFPTIHEVKKRIQLLSQRLVVEIFRNFPRGRYNKRGKENNVPHYLLLKDITIIKEKQLTN